MYSVKRDSFVCAWLVLLLPPPLRFGSSDPCFFRFSCCTILAAYICVFSHAGWRHAPSSVRPLLDKNRITFVLLVFLYQLYSSAFHYMLVFIRFSCSSSILLLCTVITREIFSDDDDVISSECFDKKERKVKERVSMGWRRRCAWSMTCRNRIQVLTSIWSHRIKLAGPNFRRPVQGHKPTSLLLRIHHKKNI